MQTVAFVYRYNSCTRVTVCWVYLCVSRIFEILSTRRHSYFLFTARSAAAWPPVNCACVPQLFQQLINTTLCPSCLRKFVCQPVSCVVCTPSNTNLIKILFSSLNSMLIAYKHSSDEFSVPQIDHKSKTSKRTVTWKILFAISMGETRYLSTENIKICGWITKLQAIKNAIWLRFLPHLQKILIFDFPR